MPSSQNFSASNPIKIMVVDDSAVIRGFISKVLDNCPDLKIQSSAANGLIAVNNLVKQKHDLIILDVEMPVMDGLTAIPKLLKVQPGVKIFMFSTLTTKNAETTMRALELGAVECLGKPTSTQDMFVKDSFKENLLRMIYEIVGARAFTPENSPQKSITEPKITTPTSSTSEPVKSKLHPHAAKTIVLRGASEGFQGRPDLLAIGSSTGGPNALFKLLGSLRGIDIPVVITQHMPPTFTKILADHIRQQTGLASVEAEDGMPLVAGRIHIAQGGHHMLISTKGSMPIIKIDDGPMENFCRPAVDPMLRSAVKVFGNKIMTVILTGMGTDGMLGCREVVKAGGRVIAQDEKSSVVWGMPGAVALDGSCSAVLPLTEIGPWLRNSCLRLPSITG
jgi:two-component system, chemotaxis family, protein-glutamate methylesterase/glutaminase